MPAARSRKQIIYSSHISWDLVIRLAILFSDSAISGMSDQPVNTAFCQWSSQGEVVEHLCSYYLCLSELSGQDDIPLALSRHVIPHVITFTCLLSQAQSCLLISTWQLIHLGCHNTFLILHPLHYHSFYFHHCYSPSFSIDIQMAQILQKSCKIFNFSIVRKSIGWVAWMSRNTSSNVPWVTMIQAMCIVIHL